MKSAAGMWIDHRKAVIVIVSDQGEETKQIESDMEKHVRFSGGSRSEQGGGEDQQDRQFTGHLNAYYDEVIAHLRDAESILIFGPGEAKGELEKRLASKGLSGRVVGIETVDKMTDRQIAAKVRQHFRK
jgi:stalled ribosome rescue protein Dom34